MNSTFVPQYKNLLVAGVMLAFISMSRYAAATEHGNEACADNIQSKIAWNNSGDKFWKSENLSKLCANTTQPKQPGECFQRVMNEHVSWGTSDGWKWENAVNLCAGTDNAAERISCFKGRIAAKVAWEEAIFQCQRSGKATG